MIAALHSARRRLLAPEVVQTSAMDCGPASLKCLLEGHRVRVSYGRLREACQTDVDGTSIDTLEDIARMLGLEAEQVLLPADHVALPEAGALPAIAVVRLPDGLNHFVVAWRRHAGALQLMDPASGRRWSTPRRFEESLYRHSVLIDSAEWRAFAGSPKHRGAIARRAEDLGFSAREAARLLERAERDNSWRTHATLDAAIRMAASMARAGGVGRGRDAAQLCRALLDAALEADAVGAFSVIPVPYWTATLGRPGDDGRERLVVTGAVMVRVRRASPDAPEAPERVLPPDLEAALREPRTKPLARLWSMLRADGLLTPAAIVGAVVASAALVVAQALLLRGLIDLAQDLALPMQRLGAMLLIAAAFLAVAMVEIPVGLAALGMGRRLELRVRMALLRKTPRLGDRYFRSRLTSDMAERAHTAHSLRSLPNLGVQILRTMSVLLLTVAGVIWLDPGAALPAVTAALVCVAAPLLLQPVLAERDIRLRTHAGGVMRFYLDTLLGVSAIRACAGERAVRREHESLLVEWARAAISLQSLSILAEAAQALLGFALAAWIVTDHAARFGDAGAVLLLAYWALAIPATGQSLADALRRYPAQRSVALRILEPLDALEDEVGPDAGEAEESAEAPVAPPSIELDGVTVLAAGRPVLRDLCVRIEPGEHVAVVGASGAGKSTLLGLVLGLRRPAEGALLIDGAPLTRERLPGLRARCAWVDPEARLWNRSLLENLRYGAGDDAPALDAVLEQAALLDVLRAMPAGLQTRLGEGGALVSGGEGQRVRLGRAMHRPGATLALLDEPFRGLDRAARATLLARARALWSDATLICVTHDIDETAGFDRVLVLDGGRIVEDGPPGALDADATSHYRRLREADRAMRERAWGGVPWRRITLDRATLRDTTEATP